MLKIILNACVLLVNNRTVEVKNIMKYDSQWKTIAVSSYVVIGNCHPSRQSTHDITSW